MEETRDNSYVYDKLLEKRMSIAASKI